MVVKPISPDDAEVRALIEALDAYQQSLYPAESNHLDSIEALARDHVFFIGVYDEDTDETLVGCGAVKIMAGNYGELKRMFVRPAARGRGVARLMVERLEAHLIEKNVPVVRLETGIHQHAAIALYEKCGYSRRPPFGPYREDPLSLFMEKRLISSGSS